MSSLKSVLHTVNVLQSDHLLKGTTCHVVVNTSLLLKGDQNNISFALRSTDMEQKCASDLRV